MSYSTALIGPLLALLLAATLSIPGAPVQADDDVITTGVGNGVATAAPPATIAVESNGRGDAEITNRLEQLYETVEGLGAVQVEVVAGMDGVLDDPAPYCTVQTLGDSNVVLRVFGWVDQKAADFLRVRSEGIRLVKLAFDDAGIVMPEPIYNLRMKPLPTQAIAGAASEPVTAPPTRERERDEPPTAIDIGRQDDLDAQIAADRRKGGDDDLLSADARKE